MQRIKCIIINDLGRKITFHVKEVRWKEQRGERGKEETHGIHLHGNDPREVEMRRIGKNEDKHEDGLAVEGSRRPPLCIKAFFCQRCVQSFSSNDTLRVIISADHLCRYPLKADWKRMILLKKELTSWWCSALPRPFWPWYVFPKATVSYIYQD